MIATWYQLVTAIHDKLPNDDTLAEVLHSAFLEVGPMPVTEEEQRFARQMQKNAGYKAVGVQQKVLEPSVKQVPRVS